MDFFKGLLVVIINSSIVVGLMSFIFKKYFDKWLSEKFEKRSRMDAFKIDSLTKLSDFLMEKELGIYPEITEVVYRLRNIIRDGINSENSYNWSPELRPLCAHLTENLYKYRLFLGPEVFDNLHEFKQIAQDALVFIDIQTREKTLFDSETYQKEVGHFKTKYERANELYEEIVRQIDKKMKSTLRI